VIGSRVLPNHERPRDVLVRDRVPHTRRRERERLRERPDRDHAGEPRRRVASELGVRLVDDQRTLRRHRAERARRVVRTAAERHDGAVVRDLGTGKPRRDPDQRIRRLVEHAHDVTRPCERSRGEQQQVVGACAEHDARRLDARVLGDRLEQRRKAAVRVPLDLCQRRREHARRRVLGRRRRCVAVEAEHLRGLDACDPSRLGRRHRPPIRLELLGQRTHRRSIAPETGRRT
jgi:hypothetical protein